MKTTNVSKTKPDETKAWFSLPFTPSSQEMDGAYATAPGTHTERGFKKNVKTTQPLQCTG